MKIALYIAVLLALFLALMAGLALFGKWFGHHKATLVKAAQSLILRIGHTAPVQAFSKRFPGTWKFLGDRISPRGYLGLHLTIGALFSLAALAAFAFVANDVFRRDELIAIDSIVRGGVRELNTPGRIGTFGVITFLGNGGTIAIIGLGLTLLLIVRQKKTLLLGWIAALAGAWTIESGLKMLFRRPRPEGAVDFLNTVSWSFPSGHALVSLVTYGMITYLAWLGLQQPKLRMTAIVVGLLIVLSIGFSRIYLGVHYFSDVIAGFSAGAMWLFTCISGLEVARRRGLVRAAAAEAKAAA